MNVDTGEMHVCFDRCDRRERCGDRVVCALTRIVLGMADATLKDRPRKRTRAKSEEEERRRETDRRLRKRVGEDKMDAIFENHVSAELKDKYVERALEMYDWLNEKIPFEAVLFATLICAREGIHTPVVCIERDEEVARYVRPVRYVGKLGIDQKAVTKAYTAIMKKKHGAPFSFLS